ncbi:MAG: hypothetical protein ABW168_25400, partial [Sedimenticola sp.]
QIYWHASESPNPRRLSVHLFWKVSKKSLRSNALLCCIFGVDAFVLSSTKEATEKMSAGAICYVFSLFT